MVGLFEASAKVTIDSVDRDKILKLDVKRRASIGNGTAIVKLENISADYDDIALNDAVTIQITDKWTSNKEVFKGYVKDISQSNTPSTNILTVTCADDTSKMHRRDLQASNYKVVEIGDLLKTVCSPLSFTTEAIDQQQATEAGEQNLGNNSTNQKLSQTFTVSQDHLMSVIVKMYKSGSPTDYVRFRLYAVDGSDHPTGSALAESRISARTVANTWGEFEVFLFAESLTADNTYALQIDRTGSTDGSNFCIMRVNTAGGYASGSLYKYNGTSWSDISVDLYFKTYQSYVHTNMDAKHDESHKDIHTGSNTLANGGVHTTITWSSSDTYVSFFVRGTAYEFRISDTYAELWYGATRVAYKALPDDFASPFEVACIFDTNDFRMWTKDANASVYTKVIDTKDTNSTSAGTVQIYGDNYNSTMASTKVINSTYILESYEPKGKSFFDVARELSEASAINGTLHDFWAYDSILHYVEKNYASTGITVAQRDGDPDATNCNITNSTLSRSIWPVKNNFFVNGATEEAYFPVNGNLWSENNSGSWVSEAVTTYQPNAAVCPAYISSVDIDDQADVPDEDTYNEFIRGTYSIRLRNVCAANGSNVSNNASNCATCSSGAGDNWWGGTGNARFKYPSTYDLGLDLTDYDKFVFYNKYARGADSTITDVTVYLVTDTDATPDNYYSKTVTLGTSWAKTEIDLDNDMTGWTSVGSPDKTDINYICFYVAGESQSNSCASSAVNTTFNAFISLPHFKKSITDIRVETSDSSSQTSYGISDLTINDPNIQSQAEAKAIALAKKATLKDPPRKAKITVNGNVNLEMAKTVNVDITLQGINPAEDLRVIEVHHSIDFSRNGEFVTVLTMDDSVPTFYERLKEYKNGILKANAPAAAVNPRIVSV